MGKGKILYVEDQKIVRDTVVGMLEKYFPKHDIETFEDGGGLEERLNQDLSGVKMILIDNNMPVIYGSQIIKKYASKLSDIPFILFYSGVDFIGKEAVKSGAYGYLLKGGDLSDMKSMFEKAVGEDIK